MNDLSVTAFTGTEGLTQLEADWRRLVREMPDPGFHHAFETHMAYARHCVEGASPPMYLALRDQHAVRVICPLEAGTDRILGRWRPVWTTIFSSRITIPYDFVGTLDAADTRGVLPAMVEFLRRDAARRGWLILDRIPATSLAWRCVQAYAPARVYAGHARSMHVIDTTQPYDTLVAARTSQLRNTLRKAERKLARLPGVRFVRFDDPASVRREVETFLTLEASGWKGAHGERSAAIFRPYLAGFLRDIATMQNDGAHAEVVAMYIGDECAASQFSIHAGTEYVLFKIAYDERFSTLSPGQVLFDWLLERCCNDPGVHRVNLITDAAWHLPWHPADVPVHSAHIALGRVSGPALAALLRLRQRVKR